MVVAHACIGAAALLCPVPSLPPARSAVRRSSPLVAVEVPGAQPVDLLYILGVVGVAAFGVRQVFDSAFPENSDEYVPPMVGSGLPNPLKNVPFVGGGQEPADPAEQAEQLRVRLLAAAEAGDLRTAYNLEKELKNLMASTGMRLVVDDEFAKSEDTEDLPDRW